MINNNSNTTPQLTPYACAQIVNRVLTEKNIDKQIPAQMMYNYVRQGLLKSYTADDGRKYVDFESFKVWLKNYINKQQQKKNDYSDVISKLDI